MVLGLTQDPQPDPAGLRDARQDNAVPRRGYEFAIGSGEGHPDPPDTLQLPLRDGPRDHIWREALALERRRARHAPARSNASSSVNVVSALRLIMSRSCAAQELGAAASVGTVRRTAIEQPVDDG